MFNNSKASPREIDEMNRTMQDGWRTRNNSKLDGSAKKKSIDLNQTIQVTNSKKLGGALQTSQPGVRRNNQTVTNTATGSTRGRSQGVAVLQNAWQFSNKRMDKKKDKKDTDTVSESGTTFMVQSKRFGQSRISADFQSQRSAAARSSQPVNSAREMALMGLRGKPEFGVEGYELRKYNPHLDKPPNFKITAGQKKTYIDIEVKAKGYIPPAHYEVMGDLNKKGKSGLGRSPRNTIAMDAEMFSKRETRPAPSTYDPKPVSPRLKGCFNFTQGRVGAIEDAEHLSHINPSSVTYTTSHKLVERNAPSPKINPIGKNSQITPYGTFKQATQLISPTTYQNNDSFKKTQLAAPKFYLSSHKGQSMVERAIKLKNHVPGTGQYNPDKGYSIITKGASKGWK